MIAEAAVAGASHGSWILLREADRPLYAKGLRAWVCACRCGCEIIRTVAENSLLSGKSTRCGGRRQSDGGGRPGRKHCSRCRTWKTRDAFYPDASRWDGISGWCRECACASQRTDETKERNRNTKRAYAAARPGRHSWSSARDRCSNPNNVSYEDYGGRGIYMVEEWSTYAQFAADMGPRPSPDHSLDRIDNDGPYAPWNCRWAVTAEQNKNRRPQVRNRDRLALVKRIDELESQLARRDDDAALAA